MGLNSAAVNRYGQPIGIFMKSRTRLGEKPDTIVGRKNADTGKYLSIGGCQAFNGLFNGSVNNIGQAGADNCASGLARPTY